MIAFNKYYNHFNFISGILIICSLVLLIFKGLNFGIDFKGGTLIELRSSDDKIKSKDLYKEIALSKNKFYSLLSLNNIIEHELEENSDNVLKLFKSVENIIIEEEQKNLLKFKKALYLIKISKIEEGNRLLKEIISSNSIWKEAALEISKR